MVLESSTSNEIHYIQFNDEASLNAIASTDWKSIIDEVEKYEKSECKYLVLKHVMAIFLQVHNLVKILFQLWMMSLMRLLLYGIVKNQ